MSGWCRSPVKKSTGFGVPRSTNDLKERLTRYRQIKISVTGRKSGRTIFIPVWFVLEAEKLYLLPVQGSDTQWYKNVLKNPSIRIDARGVEAEFRAKPMPVAPVISRTGGSSNIRQPRKRRLQDEACIPPSGKHHKSVHRAPSGV
jgi:F420H(2)-dependent quinone reductase